MRPKTCNGFGKNSSPNSAMQEEAQKLLSQFYQDVPDLTAAARGLAAWNENINATESGAHIEADDVSEQKQRLRDNFHTAVRHTPLTATSALELVDDPKDNASSRSLMAGIRGTQPGHAGYVRWLADISGHLPEVENTEPVGPIRDQAEQILVNNGISDPDGRLADGLVRHAYYMADTNNKLLNWMQKHETTHRGAIVPETTPDGSPMLAQIPR